jgi:ADP-ribose pyrophosphatase YjhB (NUDIX family)
VSTRPALLARGPWAPARVESSWREARYEPAPHLARQADAAIARLVSRGSPSHDGFAARLAAFEARADGLRLELETARWSLRLLDESCGSLVAVCLVRAGDGRWLAGRRAGWVSTWAERWSLGAAGAVEVGEDPVATLTRELHEEWGLEPDALTVEALMRLHNDTIMLIGLATVADTCVPSPDAEHDDWAWWPADVRMWPPDADRQLRRLAALLS